MHEHEIDGTMGGHGGRLVIDDATIAGVAAQVRAGAGDVAGHHTTVRVAGLGTELDAMLADHLDRWPTEFDLAATALDQYAASLEAAAQRLMSTDGSLAGQVRAE